MKLTNKKLESICDQIYNRYFTGVQVNIFNLAKVSNEIKSIYLADDSNENKNAQYLMLVEKYKEN